MNHEKTLAQMQSEPGRGPLASVRQLGFSGAGILQSPFVRALIALVLIFIIGLIFNGQGAFFKWGTHRDMLRQSAVFGILACGMTLVVISGGIDLSVGSVLGLVAVVFSLMTMHHSWPAWAAILFCLLVGTTMGLAAGGVISFFRVQPFIATLATMVFARGLAKFVTGGMKVSTTVQMPDGSYQFVPEPSIFGLIDTRIFGGQISMVTIVFALCLIICGILLSRMRAGRYLYAIGGNEEAARLSGVAVGRVKILAYSLSGLFAAVAGICQAAQEHQGDPEAGFGYELTAIAIVVIGGTNLMGGRGGILLTLLGALTIGYLEKILSINAVGEASRLMLTGLIIVAAAAFQKGRK